MHVTGGLIGQGTPEPLDSPGKSPPLLALHGFGATPRELDPVSQIAQSMGLRVKSPLLPGHGSHSRDLAQTRFSDWYAAAEAALLDLSKSDPVVLAGLSMGAVLALKLAALHPTRVCGLMVLANALTLKAPFPAWPLRMLESLPGVEFSVPKSKGPDISDPAGRKLQLTYDTHPVVPAIDLQKAGREVMRLLPRVCCPTLIVHGRFDHVCPVSNAWRVANGIGTNQVEVLILPRSWHIITRDVDAPELLGRVEEFLTRLVNGAREKPA